jgi:hypothetical protein
MKESHVERLATHNGPESCAVFRKGSGGVTLQQAVAWNVGTCRSDVKGEIQMGGLWPAKTPCESSSTVRKTVLVVKSVQDGVRQYAAGLVSDAADVAPARGNAGDAEPESRS